MKTFRKLEKTLKNYRKRYDNYRKTIEEDLGKYFRPIEKQFRGFRPIEKHFRGLEERFSQASASEPSEQPEPL
ncbi:MAG: hypothetical protein NZ929_04765 [Aigarchaeota archaeon]|nr:hypothetical protein [Aigarchaeota archaeon]MDW7986720.1 hypothetical protein [Nitrososphaerota archaeon]